MNNDALHRLYKLLACEVEKYDLMKGFLNIFCLPLWLWRHYFQKQDARAVLEMVCLWLDSRITHQRCMKIC